MTSLIHTDKLMQFVTGLKTAGVKVELDKVAGTLSCTDESVVVLRALQKGKNQPWMAMFKPGPNVRWN